jgi:hypothetical protein
MVAPLSQKSPPVTRGPCTTFTARIGQLLSSTEVIVLEPDGVLDSPRETRQHPDVTMLLHHAFSYRPWQRDIALLAMTRVIVKGARESVRDR